MLLAPRSILAMVLRFGQLPLGAERGGYGVPGGDLDVDPAGKAHYDMSTLCRLLQVSQSAFYAWLGRLNSPRAVADKVLTRQIPTVTSNRNVYGAPRVHAGSSDAGVRGWPRARRARRAGWLAAAPTATAGCM